MLRQRAGFLSVVSAFMLAAAIPAAPADKARGESAAIEAAVTELRREYAAHLRDPDAAPLRLQSTYFLDHPAAAAPAAEGVVAALEKAVANDPRLTAYVRWQLLSAAPKKFENVPRPASTNEMLMRRSDGIGADDTRWNFWNSICSPQHCAM